MLSGGIDSSMVACCAKELLDELGALGNLVAFTASQSEHPLCSMRKPPPVSLPRVSYALLLVLWICGRTPSCALRVVSPIFPFIPAAKEWTLFRRCFPLPVRFVSTERWETRCACETLTSRLKSSVGRDF